MRSPERAMLVITHYQRLLDYIKPDFVHVLAEGRIVESGGPGTRARARAARLLLGAGADRAVSALLESLAEGRAALAPPRRAALERALAEACPASAASAGNTPRCARSSARAFARPGSADGRSTLPAAAIEGPGWSSSMACFRPAVASACPPACDSAAAGRATGTPPGAASSAPTKCSRAQPALATGGALVESRRCARIEAPLHLVFVGRRGKPISPRTCATASRSARRQPDLVEHYISRGEHRHLDNQLLEVSLGEGSRLLHARVQDAADGATLLARTDARLAATAAYRRVDLELGASLSRHELNVALEGKGARFDSGGALLASGRRHVDTRLGVRHVAGETTCELLWRGLAAERGKLSFHGGIEILEGADGSDASLSNKNLLLSPHAEIDTQPVLQIHADEVKAAHGATVGRLDPLRCSTCARAASRWRRRACC
jgi:Fe-S cluster assembly protein SufD